MQIASLFEGIADVIPRRAISLCRWEELESLVCGDPHIDIEALKSNAIYQGYSKVSFMRILSRD
jgi:E3 ubiquitin-protein ligase HECTD2